jgi:uncharacterized protein
MHARLRAWVAGLLLAALALAAAAQDVLPVPALSGRVIDQTGTLGAAQVQALVQRLAALEQETGTQVVVLMVATTRPEDIAAFAHRVADSWKIGRRDVGDGVLVVVAKDDRRVRIEVAKALEGAIPDLAASRIIAEQITPAFRAGDFAGGLAAAIDRLAARIRGEGLPAPDAAARPGAAPGPQWDELAMFFFVGVPVAGALLTGLFGRKLGSLATGGATGALAWWFSASVLLAGVAGLLALMLVGVLGIGAAGRHAGRRVRRGGFGRVGPPIIWGGGSGGWGGGGGGFGGGFGSGGGGDFGGGGASGGW